MLLDGSELADRRIQEMIEWDVNNGIARRAWAQNPGALHAIKAAMNSNPDLKITLPHHADDTVVTNSLNKKLPSSS